MSEEHGWQVVFVVLLLCLLGGCGVWARYETEITRAAFQNGYTQQQKLGEGEVWVKPCP